MGKAKEKRVIKALVIIADPTVQKVGMIQIPAPLGVKVDGRTGELETPVELKLIGEPVFTPSIVCGKLINHGLQKARLIVKKTRSTSCSYAIASTHDLDIPINGVHPVCKIEPGDHVKETATVETIEIRGFRHPNQQECDGQYVLNIQVFYKVRIVVAREESICIPVDCDWKHQPCSLQEADFDDVFLNENEINIVVR